MVVRSLGRGGYVKEKHVIGTLSFFIFLGGMFLGERSYCCHVSGLGLEFTFLGLMVSTAVTIAVLPGRL